MPVWPSTPGYKEQHCGGYTAGQSSCTGQWLTSLAIASYPTKATVKPHPHEWINKPPSCIFQTDASAKTASQRAHLSQQSNYKCYFIYAWCTYSLGFSYGKYVFQMCLCNASQSNFQPFTSWENWILMLSCFWVGQITMYTCWPANIQINYI